MPDSAAVKQLTDLYDQADSFAREVTLFQEEAAFPALNELRYAGHHIIQSLSADEEEAQRQFSRAKSHCERAMYEASESGIVTALRMMAAFQKEYSDLVISDVVKDYAALCQQATRAKKLLIAGRKSRRSVVANTSTYMGSFRELAVAIETLQSSQGRSQH